MNERYIQRRTKPNQQSQYKILGLVGQGQYGRVFCASHRETGNLVALKELEHDRFSTHKFLRELRFLLSLQHPNIVTCHALEHTDTARYLVMDYCEGGTLRNLVDGKNNFSLVQGLNLITDILAGLDHAHCRGIVHCDIKPENILLSLDSKGWIARISDFGIARLSQEVGSSFLGITGSPAYMAPERFYGEYSPTSDLYAVGIMLFEIAVGCRPFSGVPGELMSAHLNKPIAVPNSVPFLLRSTISKALEKLPARRFASAAEMLKSLQLAIEVERVAPQTKVTGLKPSVSTLFKSKQKPLPVPVTDLAVDSKQSYEARGSKIVCKSYAKDAVSSQREMRLSGVIQTIALRKQGCFVVTKFPQYDSYFYSIYCLPRTKNVLSQESELSLERYKLFSLQCNDLVTAIDPQGKWMALVQSFAETPKTDNRATFQILKLPTLQPVKPRTQCHFPSPLLAIDRFHGVAVYTQIEDRHESDRAIFSAQPKEGSYPACWIENKTTFTVFQLFNRRGSFTSILKLPVSLSLVTLSQISPHRLLAIEEKNPTLALLIDLKPFKVRKIRLEIIPKFIVATAWGYAIADSIGTIMLLDPDGERIDSFMLTDPPTAIAAFDDFGLAIATWSGDRGTLHRVDLSQVLEKFYSLAPDHAGQ